MYIHIHRYIYNVNLKKNRTCDIIFTTDKILLYIETLYIVSHSLFEHQYNLNKDRQCIISKVYLILDRKKKKKNMIYLVTHANYQVCSTGLLDMSI